LSLASFVCPLFIWKLRQLCDDGDRVNVKISQHQPTIASEPTAPTKDPVADPSSSLATTAAIAPISTPKVVSSPVVMSKVTWKQTWWKWCSLDAWRPHLFIVAMCHIPLAFWWLIIPLNAWRLRQFTAQGIID
jgi:hypothetical protein